MRRKSCVYGGVRAITINKIIVEDDVKFAWDVLLYDHNAHSTDYMMRRKDTKDYWENIRQGNSTIKNLMKDWSVVHSAPICIKKDAWIGEGVTILSGVTIGEGAIIGAGSVVRDDIPAWTIAYGNPCRVVAENKYRPNTI